MTGGGTAGHVNPALAIGRHLGGKDATYLFVGVRGRAEEQVVPREGIPIRFVRASGFPGARPSLALIRFFLDLFVGTLQSIVILLAFRPGLIVGTGGFASAPVVLAGAILRRLRLSRARIVIHEQNVTPGKANRMAGRLADRVLVTFRQTLAAFPSNGLLAGYPLRRQIAPVASDEARTRLDFAVPNDRVVVFVFGGSQGARAINRAIVEALGALIPHRDRLFLIHGTGLFRSSDYDAAGDTEARLREAYTEDERRLIGRFYVARPYFHQIECVYAVTDLVVARAGAGALNEIAALGLPAIIIPKSNLPGEHQVLNARAMARHGGAELLYEETTLVDGRLVERVDGQALARLIVGLAGDAPRRKTMAGANRSFLQGDALEQIGRHVRDLVGGGEPPAPPGSSAAPDSRGEPAGAPPPAAAPSVPGPCVAESDDLLPSNQMLLARLERALAASGRAFRPEQAIPCRDDIAYLRSRAGSLLTASAWEQRNLGVKLIGLLQAREQVPLLLALLADRRPVGWIKRALGGDYIQVGFIRRNILTALGRIGEASPAIDAALIEACRDPYYEVRAEAARTAVRLAGGLTRRAEVVAAVLGLLRDRSIEVASTAAESAGRLGGAGDALPALLAMRNARFWKVRASALKGIQSLVSRGQIVDFDALRRGVADFILTSTDFTPHFEIKAAYSLVMEAASEQEGAQR